MRTRLLTMPMLTAVILAQAATPFVLPSDEYVRDGGILYVLEDLPPPPRDDTATISCAPFETASASTSAPLLEPQTPGPSFAVSETSTTSTSRFTPAVTFSSSPASPAGGTIETPQHLAAI